MAMNDARSLIIQSPADAAEIFRAAMPLVEKEERVYVLPLDACGKVLSKPILVSVGSKDGTAGIDPGSIFREAFKADAAEIIVAHNHPSGDPAPSEADREATVRLNEGAKIVGLELLDHIIIGSRDSAHGRGFVSLAELMAE